MSHSVPQSQRWAPWIRTFVKNNLSVGNHVGNTPEDNVEVPWVFVQMDINKSSCTKAIILLPANVSQIDFVTTLCSYIRTFAVLMFWSKWFLCKHMSFSSFIKVGHPCAACRSALQCYCTVQEAWRDKNSNLFKEAFCSVIDSNFLLCILPIFLCMLFLGHVPSLLR